MNDTEFVADIDLPRRKAEKSLLEGCSGQVMNLTAYSFGVPALIAGLYAALVLPEAPMRWGALAVAGAAGLYVGWAYLVVRLARYSVSTQRLVLKVGVLNIRTDQAELYRIKDVTVLQPIVYRLFGAGNVVLHTSDRSMPMIKLEAVEAPHKLASVIRERVEAARSAKGVRELD